ncbi:MAG: hypothetical protein OXO54_03715 [Chloroflexota bacterium]|nr:hypothetical protein [Chloroflexota bacterium]
MSLAVEHLGHVRREGYVVARDVLGPGEDLQPVVDEYAEVLDRRARRMYAADEIRRTCAKFPVVQCARRVTRRARPNSASPRRDGRR